MLIATKKQGPILDHHWKVATSVGYCVVDAYCRTVLQFQLEQVQNQRQLMHAEEMFLHLAVKHSLVFDGIFIITIGDTGDSEPEKTTR